MTRKRVSSLLDLLGGTAKCSFQTIESPPDTLPLSESSCGGRVKICKICGDRVACSKMANLGILPGCEIDLLSTGQGKQCIIKLHGGTISLDEPSAQNILVTPVQEDLL
jgi:Fe2+ transport system protein FeoA